MSAPAAEPRPGRTLPAAEARETGSRPGQPVPAGEPRPDKPVTKGTAREETELRPGQPATAEPRPGQAIPAAPSRPGTPAAKPRPGAADPTPAPKPFSVWEPAPQPDPESGHVSGRGSRQDGAYQPEHAEPPSADTQEKLEQLKDLYLTAEAIGEDALVKHFDELSQMQRSLIREFFEKAGLGPSSKSKLLGGDSTEDGASLPG
jgi:hypothetical protein